MNLEKVLIVEYQQMKGSEMHCGLSMTIDSD